MTASPCKWNCERRSVDCHIHCQDYIDWKTELGEANRMKKMQDEVAAYEHYTYRIIKAHQRPEVAVRLKRYAERNAERRKGY